MSDWRYLPGSSLGDALANAIERARAGSWSRKDANDTKPIDDLRALVAATEVEAARLAGDLVTLGGDELRPSGPYSGPDADKAATLLRTWEIVAKAALPTLPSAPPAAFQTGPDDQVSGASPPVGNSNPVLAAAAIYTIGAVLAVSAVAYFAAPVVDAYFARSANAQALARAQAEALAYADQHAAADEKAGKPTPWTPQQQAAFDGLLDAQKTASTALATPPANPPGGWSFLDSMGVGTAVALGIGAFLIFRK